MARSDVEAAARRPDLTGLSPVRSRSVVEMVLTQLENLFFANVFRPGERLNEVTLSQAMAVSRSSLREAARKLEQRGWLVSRPNRGFFVRSFDEAEVRDLYEARLCLEAFAVRKALRDLDAAQARTLQRHFEALAHAVGKRSEVPIIDRILAFHRALVELAGNRLLLESYDKLAMDTKLIVALIGGVQANPQAFLQRNQPILDAVLARDLEASLRALERYMGLGLGEVVVFLREEQVVGKTDK